MTKSVYIYLLDEDLRILINLINENGGECILFSDLKKYNPLLSEQDTSWYRIIASSLSKNVEESVAQGAIYVYPMRELGGSVQPMGMILDADETIENNAIISIFKIVHSYIRKNYILSSSKTIYMAPYAYLEWKSKKFKTVGLFLSQKKEYHITDDVFNDFMKWVEKNGFFFIDNTERITYNSKRYILHNEESYIIAQNHENVFYHLSNNNHIVVESESACVYVVRELSRKRRTIVSIDEMYYKSDNGSVRNIYESITAFFSNWTDTEKN